MLFLLEVFGLELHNLLVFLSYDLMLTGADRSELWDSFINRIFSAIRLLCLSLNHYVLFTWRHNGMRFFVFISQCSGRVGVLSRVKSSSFVFAEVEHCPVTAVTRLQFLAETVVLHDNWHPVLHLDVWEASNIAHLLLEFIDSTASLLGNHPLLFALLLDRPFSWGHI